MYPGGFAKVGDPVVLWCDLADLAQDYAMIGELMRHDYYAIHNDTVLTPDK